MSTYDYRALCVELTDCLEKADWPLRHRYVFRQWIDIARAALADEPAVPQGRKPAAVITEPSDEELLDLLPQGTESGFWLPKGLPSDWVDGDFIAPPKAIIAFARDVLELWGNTAPPPASVTEQPKPVPVSERPWEREGWCDELGRCWWGRPDTGDWSADWTLATPEAIAEFCEFSPQTVCLPAHALPLPEVGE